MWFRQHHIAAAAADASLARRRAKLSRTIRCNDTTIIVSWLSYNFYHSLLHFMYFYIFCFVRINVRAHYRWVGSLWVINHRSLIALHVSSYIRTLYNGMRDHQTLSVSRSSGEWICRHCLSCAVIVMVHGRRGIGV